MDIIVKAFGVILLSSGMILIVIAIAFSAVATLIEMRGK